MGVHENKDSTNTTVGTFELPGLNSEDVLIEAY